MKIDYPFITETDPREQVQEIKAYLFQTVDALNRILDALEANDTELAKEIESIADGVERTKQNMDEQHQFVMNYIDEKISS